MPVKTAARKAEAEARRKADEEARRAEAEEAERIAAEAARRALEVDAIRMDAGESLERAEEEARLIAEAEARQRAEEEARRVDEEIVRRVAEEVVRREAEEAVRREAEEAVRRETEEALRREVEEAVRLRMEAEARQRAEEEARRKAEQELARKAAEDARGRAEEEAQRRFDEEARRREVEDANRKAEEEARRRLEDEAKRVAAEEELRKAEEAVRQQAEADAAQKAAVEARRQSEEEARRQGEEEAGRNRESVDPASLQLSRPSAPPIAPMEAPLLSRRARKKLFAGLTFLVICGTVLGGAGFLVARGLDVSFYEALAAEYFGKPVRIQSAALSFLPSPAMQFNGVVVGDDQAIKATVVRAIPEISTLFGGERHFSSITIDGGTVSSDILGSIAGATGRAGAKMAVQRIEAHNLTIVDRSWTMSDMDVSAKIEGARGVSSIVLRDAAHTMTITLTAAPAGRTQFEINAQRIRPIGASFELTDFDARGIYGADEINVEKFDGRVFDGVIRGTARMRLQSNAFAINGSIEAKTLELSKLAAGIFESGQVSAQGRFSGAAASVEKLLATPTIEMTYTIDKGTIQAFDISRAVQGAENLVGTTPISAGSGTFQVNGGRINVSGFRFKSGSIAATGSALIDASGNLNGQVGGELRTPGGTSRGSVALSGTLAKPSFARAR